MLEIIDISKDMGEFLLDAVSLQVEKGDYLVIIGPTGAGKTILLETVAGVYPPDHGRIRLNGEDITYREPKDRNICMVYQDYMLFPHLTVEENVGFGLKVHRVNAEEKKRRVREIVDIVGITHLLHRYPDTLSGGEKQRAALSRAIVLNPEVLLLDEPLSALDGQTREMMRGELKRLHTLFQTTIIHITHNFQEVFSLADKVAVMNNGKIVQYGIPDAILRRPNCEFVAQFVGGENLFKGTCKINGDMTEIDVGGEIIVSSSCASSQEVYVSIRPEDIIISKNPVQTSARNIFSGIVTDVIDNGTLVTVFIDTGIHFRVVLTRQGWQEMDISRGEELYLLCKASSVHLFS